jgi:hypothetical protein
LNKQNKTIQHTNQTTQKATSYQQATATKAAGNASQQQPTSS